MTPDGGSPAIRPRIFALLGLLAAFVLALFLLFGRGGSGYEYTLLFQTGGQLVPGNEVLVAGQPYGTVQAIELTDDAEAAVRVRVEEPLRQGTSAVIRMSSLSGVANRYVSLTLGPDNARAIEEGGTLGGEETTTPVDLDQLFDLFREPERRALKKFIRGNATVYGNDPRLANRAYRFLNPALSTSERLFAELSRDSVALERLLVDGAVAFGAIAERRDDLSSFVADANQALGAIAERNTELDRSLAALPGALRQGSTTFVNLRSTLDDLDPLVAVSKPATRDLAPFLRSVRPVARAAVPVFSDLRRVVSLPGGGNDLADALADLPPVAARARPAFRAGIRAMDDSQDNLAFLRPYSPDVFSWLAKFAQASAPYDANGHYLRVMPAGTNVFSFDAGLSQLEEIYSNQAAQFDAFDFGVFKRCPGGATQRAPDLSNPFLDDGNLSGECDPADIPPSLP